MNRVTGFLVVVFAVMLLVASLGYASEPTGAAFTYQGQLKQGGNAINATADFQFTLWDAAAGPAQIGGMQPADGVVVADGRFTVELDFGVAFGTDARWLEIAVRSPAGDGPFITLAPRQRLNAAPYALYALNAMIAGTQGNALNFTNVGNTYAGSGASLTNLNASNINSGTVGSAQIAGMYSNALNFNNVSNVFSGTFSGSGAGLTSVNANLLDGLDSTAFLQSTVPLALSGNSATYIFSAENTDTNNFSSALYGRTTGSAGRGVYGVATHATGFAFGGHFQSQSTSGRGVVGEATALTGVTYGGYFETDSSSGIGAFGLASSFTGVNSGLNGQTLSNNGYGVRGVAGNSNGPGTAYGVFGESFANEGHGVFGLANSNNGVNYGVHGQSNSQSGTGVFGEVTDTAGVNYGVRGDSPSTAGTGVVGVSSATTGSTYGGNFYSASTAGHGVAGRATAATGPTIGVYGQCSSTSGFAFYGIAQAASGSNQGGHFESASSGGYGVVGYNSATTGTTYGGYFQSDSPDGRAVFGQNIATTGLAIAGRFGTGSSGGRAVWSSATAATGTTYGVYGEATSASGYGVWAQGRMGASGTKPFRIDHPDDPANKYLIHYSSESPEVINFYRGTVVLNGAGEAIVELPHYFAKINKEPSYTLTAIGGAMPNLHVADEIDANSLSIGSLLEPSQTAPPCWFRIAGGAPGMKVSWRVEAVRNDRFVQQRGAPVEIEKEGSERGTYQHPEFYDQPPEKGLNYDAKPSLPRQIDPERLTEIVGAPH